MASLSASNTLLNPSDSSERKVILYIIVFLDILDDLDDLDVLDILK